MSLATLTRSQSSSVKVNADHRIFFLMRPLLRRMVVIGPYRVSPDCRKRLMAYKIVRSNNQYTVSFTHLAQLIRAIKHSICWSPSDIAVEGDPKWLLNLALNLELLKVLNTLTWSLNLTESWVDKLRIYSEIWQTLIATVRMAEMTSNDPPSTRLFANEGSYSHIAVVVSIAAILVMWPITATLAMLTTWPKHLMEWTGELDLFGIIEWKLTEVGVLQLSKGRKNVVHGKSGLSCRWYCC